MSPLQSLGAVGLVLIGAAALGEWRGRRALQELQADARTITEVLNDASVIGDLFVTISADTAAFEAAVQRAERQLRELARAWEQNQYPQRWLPISQAQLEDLPRGELEFGHAVEVTAFGDLERLFLWAPEEYVDIDEEGEPMMDAQRSNAATEIAELDAVIEAQQARIRALAPRRSPAGPDAPPS